MLWGCITRVPQPCPCPQPPLPPRCARCCHMRVNVRGPVHPSGRIHHPAARGARSDARVSRSPCAATDGGGCPLRPENLGKHRLEASPGLGSASTTPPSASPPSQLHPRVRGPQPGVGGPEPYEGRGTSWPSGAAPAPRSQQSRSQQPWGRSYPTRLPAPAAFPTSSEQLRLFLPSASQESFLRGHLHHFGVFAQGIVTPFQRKEGEKQPKPRAEPILLPDTFSWRIQSRRTHHESVRHSG